MDRILSFLRPHYLRVLRSVAGVIFVVFSAGSTTGCTLSTGPTGHFVGVYKLQLSDESGAPRQVPAPAGCVRLLNAGYLHLLPPGGAIQPIYSLQIHVSETCTGRSPESVLIWSDSGLWSIDGTTLFFNPSAGSRYRGTGMPDETPVSVLITHEGVAFRFLYESRTPLP